MTKDVAAKQRKKYGIACESANDKCKGKVKLRPDWYSRDVNNDLNAKHVACKYHNEQNALDI